MEDDFGMSSSQYSIIVLVFFISYLVFEVPANMILTRVRPSVFLSGLGVIWGSFAALMGATQTWSQLAGIRFLLGIAEVCNNPYSTTESVPLTNGPRLALLLGVPFSSRRGTASTNSPPGTPSCTLRSRLRERFRGFSLVSSPTIWMG